MRWRKAERERLLAQRKALPAADRQLLDSAIEQHVDAAVGDVRGVTVGIYWPINAEPNLRRWMERIHAQGAQCALPVVRERAAPLVFYAWEPGAPMRRGNWGIPEPADARLVQPGLLIVPMVGFNEAGYRLGYGGGYFDRTLASLSPRPRTIGIAYSAAFVPAFSPLAHDIPLDRVITELGPVRRA